MAGGLRTMRGRSFLAAGPRDEAAGDYVAQPGAAALARAREPADLSGEEAQAAPDLVLVDDGGGVPVADAMLVS